MNYALPSIVDFDDMFARTANPIVFNELMLSFSTEEVVGFLCDISSDRESSTCQCECGKLVGNYYSGMKCRSCNSICESNLFGEIKNDSWLEIPKSIKGVLNPQVFRILSKWIGNTKVAGSLTHQPIVELILNMRLPQEPIAKTPFFAGMGFNWFYDNFDAVVDYFMTSHPSPSGRTTAKTMDMFLKKTGSAIWCTKLPILSKIIQPITRVNKNVRYADTDLETLIKAVFTLRSVLLSEKMMKFSSDHVDRNFFRVYYEFICYTNTIIREKLPRKPSVLRKHVFGSRSHCSCRSVAVPIASPHSCDEVYLPWKLGVMVFKYHIISVLTRKRNMTTFDAYNRVTTALNMYDYDIDLIMQGLIRDCPYKGIPILMNRNPSLRIASIQLLFVTKVKPALEQNPFPSVPIVPTMVTSFEAEETNDDVFDTGNSSSSCFLDENAYDDTIYQRVKNYVEDGTIEVSPMIVKGPNLDFDGDEINVIPIFEMDEVPKFMRLYPAHRTISTEKLAMEGGDVMLSSQQFCILNGWINDPTA